MDRLSLKDRNNFKANYLDPALKKGLLEMTEPNSPNSPSQKYRLTKAGRAVRSDEESA